MDSMGSSILPKSNAGTVAKWGISKINVQSHEIRVKCAKCERAVFVDVNDKMHQPPPTPLSLKAKINRSRSRNRSIEIIHI